MAPPFCFSSTSTPLVSNRCIGLTRHCYRCPQSDRDEGASGKVRIGAAADRLDDHSMLDAGASCAQKCMQTVSSAHYRVLQKTLQWACPLPAAVFRREPLNPKAPRQSALKSFRSRSPESDITSESAASQLSPTFGSSGSGGREDLSANWRISWGHAGATGK